MISTDQMATENTTRMKRRGLIAGAAAIVTTMLAAKVAEPVAAADGNGFTVGGSTNAFVPANNQATSLSSLLNTASTAGFRVRNNYSGIFDTTLDAVQGYTTGVANAGILGRNDDLNGVGSVGVASNGTGVFGQSSGGSAVVGSSVSGAGFYGTSDSGYGLVGLSNSRFGVLGTIQSGSTASGTIALYGANLGVTPGGTGLVGLSQSGSGVVGTANINVPNGSQISYAGVVGNSGGTNTYAGLFYGNVAVGGNFAVLGTKSAAVPHSDGSHRLVYCVEAPESWLEDFGTGTLVNGRAEVKIASDFAGIIDAQETHVFLAPHGDFQAHVAQRTSSGFTAHATTGAGVAARAVGGETSGVSGTFSYRILARRKDVPANRLAKFEVPKAQPSLQDLGKNPGVVLPKSPARHKS